MEYSRPDTLFLRADTILTFVTEILSWPDSLAAPLSAASRRRLEGYRSLQAIADAMPVLLKLLPDDIRMPGCQNDIADKSVAESTDTFPVVVVDSLNIKPGYDRLGRDSSLMVPKEYYEARALGRARFFNKDLQGIADTLIFREVDSILNMIRKPVVWSGERQVYGNRIDVHFNDSAADWALLPESGMVAEHLV